MSGLRACLLSGGLSRRMGQDKALLPHPGGGTWLDFSLARLASLPAPITLLSRHASHHALAAGRRDGRGDAIECLWEPVPREGPLLALHRLMQRHPDQRLLLCPVDMPWLESAALEALLHATAAEPGAGSGPGPAPEGAALHLAHDGTRLQPLLGIYPAHARHRRELAAFTAAGGRRLQDWLAGQTVVPVVLPAAGLRNANRPADVTALWP